MQAFCTHYGIEPADVLAARGPSLGPSASEFVNFADEFGSEFNAFYNAETKSYNFV